MNNLYLGLSTGNKEHYAYAAIEALCAVGIEVSQYFDRRKAQHPERSLEELDQRIIRQSDLKWRLENK